MQEFELYFGVTGDQTQFLSPRVSIGTAVRNTDSQWVEIWMEEVSQVAEE